MNKEYKYCNSLTEYSRFLTREVSVGDIKIGGNNPLRIQSMTTTDTMDTIKTVEQTIRMVDSGCELVRITAPSIKEAKNLRNIKEELKRRGYNVPLIADIHFTPNAAEEAARIVEKVRVNPGNYVDKKKFQQIEYTDSEYEAEIERITERFSPLVKICKEYGTAMRIGTNHGSLSDRIMSRYGDTPLGMVESALEFLRISKALDYHNIILSMKASNTQVMVQAYRLLINKMIEEDMDYPLHLGVTEAGDGEDGRIKSAVGIGTLLEDGLGDTIRVSLTEEPENEAPVAIALADRYTNRAGHKSIPQIHNPVRNPFEYLKRTTDSVTSIGSTNVPKVIADLSTADLTSPEILSNIGYNYSVELDKWNTTEIAADYLYLGESIPNFDIPPSAKSIYDIDVWNNLEDKSGKFPLFSFNQFLNAENKSPFLNFVKMKIDDFKDENFTKLASINNAVLVLETDNEHAMPELRSMVFGLENREIQIPVIIKRDYKNITEETFQLYASTDIGGLLIDGLGDGVWSNSLIINKSQNENLKIINRTLFGILQAARVRISKTEYIACPSCGRTLFDLVDVTNKIRSRTEHLKGVKIGIMGCIVNGPGEMADADYGYVGSGPGKITLYKSKEVVKRGIPSEVAVDQLIELIKEDGNWIEPSQ